MPSATDFLCEYELPAGGAVNGSLTMTFVATKLGAADAYAPHVVTFANGSCTAGKHTFAMADLSVAADEIPAIVVVSMQKTQSVPQARFNFPGL